MCGIAIDEQSMPIKLGRAELQRAHLFLLCSPPFINSVLKGTEESSDDVSGLWLSPSLLSGSEGCALCTKNISRAGPKTSWPTFLQSCPLQFRLALDIVGMWISYVFLTFKMRYPMFYHLSLCCSESYLVLTSRLLAISLQFWTVSYLYCLPFLNILIIYPEFFILTLMVFVCHSPDVFKDCVQRV